jgi:uncharacterized protein YneF (UPF0154 family)
MSFKPCPKCGEPGELDARFCTRCGGRFPHASPARVAAAPILAIVLGTLALGLALVIGVVFLALSYFRERVAAAPSPPITTKAIGSIGDALREPPSPVAPPSSGSGVVFGPAATAAAQAAIPTGPGSATLPQGAFSTLQKDPPGTRESQSLHSHRFGDTTRNPGAIAALRTRERAAEMELRLQHQRARMRLDMDRLQSWANREPLAQRSR